MRPWDPGAGKRTHTIDRRRFLQGGLGVFCLSAIGTAAAEPALLSPGATYFGARLLRRVDPQGMPSFQPDTFGPMTHFIFPVGVAATPVDVYIADAGHSALFRYDPSVDAMMVVPGVAVTQQTRIAAVYDGSVVVADGRLGVPRRYSRNGRQLPAIDPRNTGSRFDEIAVDPVSGRYLGLDRVQRRIEEVHPLGRSSGILPEGLLPHLPSTMALDRQTLYAAAQDCQCITVVDLVRRDSQVLVEDLAQVTAMAAGDGWLVVADNVERILRIYRERTLRGDPDYESLGLMNPLGLSIARGVLYVADAGTRRIVTFRLRP